MKIKVIFSWIFVCLFTLSGLFTAGIGIFTAFHEPDAQPVMLRQPEHAYSHAEQFLQNLDDGDLQAAANCLLGQPSLGIDRSAQDAAGQLMWDGFMGSFSCKILGACYPSESGVSLDVSITCLDLDKTMEPVGERALALLQQKQDHAQTMDEIYDASGNYLESLLEEVIVQAVEEALAQSRYMTRDVTLSLVYQEGQWWVLPEAELMEAISCGLLS